MSKTDKCNVYSSSVYLKYLRLKKNMYKGGSSENVNYFLSFSIIEYITIVTYVRDRDYFYEQHIFYHTLLPNITQLVTNSLMFKS